MTRAHTILVRAFSIFIYLGDIIMSLQTYDTLALATAATIPGGRYDLANTAGKWARLKSNGINWVITAAA